MFLQTFELQIVTAKIAYLHILYAKAMQIMLYNNNNKSFTLQTFYICFNFQTISMTYMTVLAELVIIIYLQYPRHNTMHLELTAHFVKSPFLKQFLK